MRIGYIQNVNFTEATGGAELTDFEVYKEAIKRGHDVRIFTPQTIDMLNGFDPDFLIISNCIKFDKTTIDNIVLAREYAFFAHDYYPPIRHQLYYCEEDKKRCVKEITSWIDFFRNANLIIWLSPLHRQTYIEMFKETYPELKDKPYHLLLSPVEGNKFTPGEKIKNTVLTINSLYRFKGSENVIKYTKEHPEFKFTFVGPDPENLANTLPKNCKYVGTKFGRELIKLYQESEYFLHFPLNYEPCGRVVIEAVLCGCKIIHNGRIGALSYPEAVKNGKINREWFRDETKKSPKKLWEHLEEVFS